MFFDFDGTLSDIVDDPAAALPVAGPSPARSRRCGSWPRNARSRFCPAATSPTCHSASVCPGSGMPAATVSS